MVHRQYMRPEHLDYKLHFHFTNALVAVVFSQLCASSSTLCNNCRPPSNFLNEYKSTIWFHGLLFTATTAAVLICKTWALACLEAI